MKRTVAVFVGALAAVLVMPIVATAHNAGHIFLPVGTCQELGSFKSSPLVGQDRTPLDLVPQTPNPPRDEYGVSFVGYWDGTPISPGGCPAPLPAVTTTQDSAGIPEFAVLSFQ
jgi:hypothetical protein